MLDVLSLLLQNFSVLVAVALLSLRFVTEWPVRPRRPQVIAMLLIWSVLPVLLYHAGPELSPGLKFDLRNVPPVMATLWGGPVAGVVVGLPFVAYRLMNATAGSLPGIMSLSLVILSATLLRRRVGIAHQPGPLTARQMLWITLILMPNGLPVLLLPDGGAVLQQIYLPLLALNVTAVYVVGAIVNERLRAVAALNHAEHALREDALTLTGSRRRFDRDLADLSPHDVLMMLDIDHFKEVNDAHGHVAGDRVLSEVAEVIRQTLRSTDTAYRYGGEEFALILRGAAPGTEVMVAERLRQVVGSRPIAAIGGRCVTVSIGVARVGTLGPARALLAADDHLYRAKRDGRNAVRIHELTPAGAALQLN